MIWKGKSCKECYTIECQSGNLGVMQPERLKLNCLGHEERSIAWTRRLHPELAAIPLLKLDASLR
eukprot:m.86611 g.86611  ORF g.86611 m.86611 type:complete len:65 (+) comp14474_c0_seq2:267-461(+)